MNKLFKQTGIILGLMSFFGIILTGCSQTANPTIESNTEPLRRTEFVLGTTATISLYDHQSEDILDKVFDRITVLENALSINKTGTLLDEVNTNAGIKPVKVDPDTFDVIQKGLHYTALTEGSFDITVGPIVKLWNIGFPDARVPSQDEIEAKLPLINYNALELNEMDQTIFLKEKGMLIDLGGIGKGYAADEIVKVLQDNNVEHAIVDLGGNIYTLGNKPNGDLWKIGLQDPFNPRGKTIGYIPVENKSVVTSGIYERFIEQDGKKYHHILNPETGYPFENEIAGVTIVSDKSIDGDAISTSVFSKGIEGGIDFVNTLDGVEAIFITKDSKVYTTPGIKENFVLTNGAFKLQN